MSQSRSKTPKRKNQRTLANENYVEAALQRAMEHSNEKPPVKPREYDSVGRRMAYRDAKSNRLIKTTNAVAKMKEFEHKHFGSLNSCAAQFASPSPRRRQRATITPSPPPSPPPAAARENAPQASGRSSTTPKRHQDRTTSAHSETYYGRRVLFDDKDDQAADDDCKRRYEESKACASRCFLVLFSRCK